MDAAQNSGTPAQMPEPAATEQKTDMAGTATERLKKAFFHQMRDVQPKQDTLDLFAQIVLVLDAHFTKYCSFYDPLLLLQKQEQLPSFYSSFFGQTRDLNKISVSALTKEAGINRTTFYKLFPNVQALYDACCEDLTQEFLSIPIPKEKTAADMLKNYGLVLWSTMKREQETMTLLSHRIPRRDLPYKIAMRLRAHLAASLRTEERVSFTVHENLAVFPDLFSTWLSQIHINALFPDLYPDQNLRAYDPSRSLIENIADSFVEDYGGSFLTYYALGLAALKLLSAKDRSSITVSALCTAAGYPRSTFYVHFTGIEDYVFKCCEHVVMTCLSAFLYFLDHPDELTIDALNTFRGEMVGYKIEGINAIFHNGDITYVLSLVYTYLLRILVHRVEANRSAFRADYYPLIVYYVAYALHLFTMYYLGEVTEATLAVQQKELLRIKKKLYI